MCYEKGILLVFIAASFPNAELYINKVEYDAWMAMSEGQNARFDADHEQSVITRKSILKMGQENGLTLYGMHFPAPYYL